MQVIIDLQQPVSSDLYRHVRAAAAMTGTSLTKLAKHHDTTIQNIKQALVGSWTGKKAEDVKLVVIEHLKQKLQNKGE